MQKQQHKTLAKIAGAKMIVEVESYAGVHLTHNVNIQVGVQLILLAKLVVAVVLTKIVEVMMQHLGIAKLPKIPIVMNSVLLTF